MTAAPTRGGTLAAALVMVAVALARFAPLAACGGDCIVDFEKLHGTGTFASHLLAADVYLNSWILAWDAHALTSSPAGLFDANVLHPAPKILTGSEHLLGTAVPLLPLGIAGVSAVGLHRIAMLAAAALTGFTTFLLVRWLCGSAWAALTAGILAVLSPWRIGELSHVQLLSTSWFALCWLLALRTMLEGPRISRTLGLFVVLTLQMLSSYYLAFYLCAALAIFALCAVTVGRAQREGVLTFLAVWAAAAGVLTVFSAPYIARGVGDAVALQGGRLPDPGMVRALIAVTPSFALPWSTLLTSGAPYAVPASWLAAAMATLMPRNRSERVFARAVSDAELADKIYADGHEPSTRRADVATFALWGCVGIAVLMAAGSAVKIAGLRIPLPAALASMILPGFENLRAPLRWEILAALAIPVLVGIGLARLQTRRYLRHEMPDRPDRILADHSRTLEIKQNAAHVGAFEVVVLLLLCANVSWQALPTTPSWTAHASNPAAYQALAALDPAPVVEIPWPLQPDHDAVLSSAYMAGSTLHWLPLLNGYTAYMPRSYTFLRTIGAELPARDSIDKLAALTGLGWALVHFDAADADTRGRWQGAVAARDVAEAWRGENAAIYQLYSAEEPGRLTSALLAPSGRQHTFEGLLRTPLELSQVAGTIEAGLPPTLPLFAGRRFNYRLPVRIRNTGGSDWPGFDIDPEGLVHVHYVLQPTEADASARAQPRQALSAAVPINRDVRAGQTLQVNVALQGDAAPGEYTLSLGLIQRTGSGWRKLPIEPITAKVSLRRSDSVRGSEQ